MLNRIVFLCGTSRAIPQVIQQWLDASGTQFINALPSDLIDNPGEKPMHGCIIIGESLSVEAVTRVLEQLQQAHSCLIPIIISAKTDLAYIVRVMRLGAINVLPVDVSTDVVTSAIEESLEFSWQHTNEWNRRMDILARINKLSTRQKEVMDFVVGGASNKTIAAELHLSPKTVEVHRASVMRKMQAKSLPDLVKFSMAQIQKPYRGVALSSPIPIVLPISSSPSD